jgi:hypothetical protein
MLVTLGVTLAGRVALASFATQNTTLIGPMIAGLVPEGSATINQNAQPSSPGILTLHVKNVALENGTILGVTLDGESVGTMVVHGGTGTLWARLPLQAGRLSSLKVNFGTTIVLSADTPWVVPWPITP